MQIIGGNVCDVDHDRAFFGGPALSCLAVRLAFEFAGLINIVFRLKFKVDAVHLLDVLQSHVQR